MGGCHRCGAADAVTRTATPARACSAHHSRCRPRPCAPSSPCGCHRASCATPEPTASTAKDARTGVLGGRSGALAQRQQKSPAAAGEQYRAPRP
eukprot:5251142-Prymnesium_polylepis.2